MRFKSMEARQAALRSADPYATGETVLARACAHEHAVMSAWVPGHSARCTGGEEHQARRQHARAEADRRRALWEHARHLNTETLRLMSAGWPDDMWQARIFASIIRKREEHIRRYRERTPDLRRAVRTR